MKLYARGKKGTLSIKYRIPTHMRATLGREKTYDIWKSTGTADCATARQRAPRILADIIESVERDYKAIKANAPRMTQHEFITAAQEIAEKIAGGESFGLSEDSITKLQAEGKLPFGVAYEDDDPVGDGSVILTTLIEKYFEGNPETTAELRTAKTANKIVNSGGSYLPLSVAAERHLRDMQQRDVTASAVTYARNTLDDFGAYSGDPDVADVTKRMAGDWITDNVVPMTGRDGKTPAAEESKVKRIGFMRAAWAFFKRKGLTETNPFEDMDALVRGSKRGKKKLTKRAWTQDELNTLNTLDHSDPMYAVSVIRLHSGARVEEICCLRVEDIDLGAGTMAIGHGDDAVKNESSVRVLPLHSVTRKVIEEWLPKATDEGYLFDLKRAGADNTRSHNLNKRLGRWIRANVSKDAALTSYTLRHTYAQALRNLGVDQATIEWTTGHKDQSMLFGTYAAEVGIERLRDAVCKLDFDF